MDSAPAGTRTLIFNASGSSDYEGRTLGYFWFAGAPPATASIHCDNTATTVDTSTPPNTILWGAALIGQGITLNYTFPTSGAKTVTLVACDPGFRSGTASKGVTA